MNRTGNRTGNRIRARVAALTLLLLLLTCAAGLAHPAMAKRMPPRPTMKLTSLTKVTVANCSTDGGKVPCSDGVKYFATLLQRNFAAQIKDAPIVCGDGKAGKLTFRFGFEYNDGTMVMLGTEAQKAALPACVKQLSTDMSTAWLGWFKLWQPIDPLIDARNEYTVTVVLGLHL
jgi:hypothetical protein